MLFTFFISSTFLLLTQYSCSTISMGKRKITSLSTSSATSTTTKNLTLYKKSYKGGGKQDPLYEIFQETQRLTSPTKVLYPGCHRHLTAALVFSHVQFVDYDVKVGPLFSTDDTVVRDYVEENTLYKEDETPTFFEFHCCNVEDTSTMMKHFIKDEFDLLISLNAGIIAKSCMPFIQPSGFLLVNDGHSEARAAFVSGDWDLFAYWDDETKKFVTDPSELERCFQVIVPKKTSKDTSSELSDTTKNTRPINIEEVQESIAIGTVRKRSFKLLFEPMYFIFQRMMKQDAEVA